MIVPILLSVIPVGILLFLLSTASRKPTHAGGIVYRRQDGRTLFLVVSSSSKKDKWVFPKGHIDKGEKPAAAAVREVMEEAGVRAKPLKKAGTTKYSYKGKRYCVIYYVMRVAEFNGEESLENRQVLWLDKEQALEKLGSSSSAKLLKKLAV